MKCPYCRKVFPSHYIPSTCPNCEVDLSRLYGVLNKKKGVLNDLALLNNNRQALNHQLSNFDDRFVYIVSVLLLIVLLILFLYSNEISLIWAAIFTGIACIVINLAVYWKKGSINVQITHLNDEIKHQEEALHEINIKISNITAAVSPTFSNQQTSDEKANQPNFKGPEIDKESNIKKPFRTIISEADDPEESGSFVLDGFGHDDMDLPVFLRRRSQERSTGSPTTDAPPPASMSADKNQSNSGKNKSK